jgi:hypothetical protein
VTHIHSDTVMQVHKKSFFSSRISPIFSFQILRGPLKWCWGSGRILIFGKSILGVNTKFLREVEKNEIISIFNGNEFIVKQVISDYFLILENEVKGEYEGDFAIGKIKKNKEKLLDDGRRFLNLSEKNSIKSIGKIFVKYMMFFYLFYSSRYFKHFIFFILV